MKRMLSMFLALCMVMTLLPVSAMAEETRMPIETSGEIVNFAPLTETEKTASLGTSIEDLELPETLTATVRTPVSIEEDSVQDSGSPDTVPPTTATEPQWVENTVDIQVEWKSTPEYDMNTGGEYAFTPMIEGYTVNAPLPEITVTVGEMPLMASAMLLTAGVLTEVEVDDLDSLQSEISDAEGDLYLKLIANVSTTEPLKIYSDNNITIDLNGKTLHSTSEHTISKKQSGTLTIKDSGTGGTVSASGNGAFAIYNEGSGDVSISGGTVSASGGMGTAFAICNAGSGDVSISGVTVSASGKDAFAIYNQDSGDVSISGCTVSSSSCAIWNYIGTVSISGGAVSASGISSYAIYNSDSGGKVSISGGAVSASGEGSKAIHNGGGTVEISGCTVSASGDSSSAIYDPFGGNVSISGGTVSASGSSSIGIVGAVSISGGTSTISGEGYAMDIAPNLSGYANVQITASTTKTDGTETSVITKADINPSAMEGYKYLKFEPVVAQIGSKGYTTLIAAVDEVEEGETIMLLDNITQTWSVQISTTKSFELDLNGKTLHRNNGDLIIYSGSGTLTIKDSGTGGTVSASGDYSYAIFNSSSGNVSISGGKISASGDSAAAIYNSGDGTVEISGGTVSSSGNTAAAIYNEGSGTVEISGGTVSASDAIYDVGSGRAVSLTGGYAIRNYDEGTVSISGGAVSASGKYANAIYNSGGTVEISEGTVSAIGNYSDAISNFGTVEISEGTVSASGDSSSAIFNDFRGNVSISGGTVSAIGERTCAISNSGGTVEISEGTVSASGDSSSAISINGSGDVSISGCTVSASGDSSSAIYDAFGGTVSISGGTSNIAGEGYAMNIVPDLSGYANVQITASKTATDGSTASVITQDDIDTPEEIETYKYLKFGPELKSLTISTSPTKAYEYGDYFDKTGMVVTADYKDGTVDTNFTAYTVDKTGPLTLSDTKVTLTANGTSITTTLDITVAKKTPTTADLDYSLDSVDYDGNPKSVSVTAKTGTTLGAITVKYGGDTTAPINAGTYAITVDIAENDGCYAVTALPLGYFTIKKIAYAGTKTVSESVFTDGKTGATVTLPELPVGSSYGTPTTGGAVSMTDMSITGTTLNYNAPKSTAGQSGTMTIPVTGINYNDYSIVITVIYIKSDPAIADLDYSLDSVNYDGNAKPVSVTAKTGTTLGAITVKYDGDTTAPTNAGTYVITVDIAGNDEYNAVTALTLGNFTIKKIAYAGTKTVSESVFTDGKTGATVTLPELPAGSSYGTPTAGGAVSMTDMSIAGITLTYTAPVSTAEQSGTMTIPVTGANYDDYSIVVTVTYKAKTPQVIFYAKDTIAKKYGDAMFTNLLTETTVDGTITYASNNASVATVDNTGEVTILSVGSTTITAIAAETDTHAQATASYTLTVDKADSPAPNVSFAFDGGNANKLVGATALMEYSLNGGSNWTDCSPDMDMTGKLSSITAENDIRVRVKATTTHNEGVSQTIDITQPSAPTIGKTDETSALNNGTITDVSNLMEYRKDSNTSYTAISGNTVAGLEPGTYHVRYKAAGTALASPLASVTIDQFVKSDPAIADLDYSLDSVDYDGTEKAVSVIAKTGTTLGAITVKYGGSTTAPTNAGTYAITVDIVGNDEYNAVTALPLGNFTINKIAYTGTNTVSASVFTDGKTGATVTLPELPAGSSYGTPTTGGAVSMTGMSIAGTTLNYNAPASTAGQIGKMTIPVTGATNYNDYNIVVTVTYEEKTPQVISYATDTIAKKYGDAMFTNLLTETTVKGTITYASNNASVATVDNTGEVTILSVGSTTITAIAAETDTHAQATASYTLTVSKKALTLKADDKSMTKGDGIPTFTYTVIGLKQGDAVTTPPAITTTADGTTVGSFDITISGGDVANAPNYDITYTNGTLTVAERLFTGGSSSNDNSSSVIVTPPPPDKPNSPTQGEIKAPGTVDGKGNITVNITDKAVTDVFDKALADAKKNGNEQNGITVILRVDTGNMTGSSVTVNLPKTVQDIIIANKIANTIVVVDNPEIRIEMDLATVQEINKQAKSDVNITATRTDNGKLTADAKKAIGSRPVFDLRVNYGNGQAVSSFGTGSVTVTIPYILGANEKAGNVKAVYVDAKGKVHWLTNSIYDSVAKVLHFATSHFSTYGIGYKQVNTAFADITAHWAKEDIEFVVNRGLFSGTSDTTFSPNTDMTRGMFVTVLGRLANADVSDYTKSSFADVKSDAYYMGYIEWANKNKIVNGIGDNKFAPDQSITREQMAVIMQNYAKVIGFTLPKVYEENAFADNTKISTYAKEAVTQMQMAGVINGKNSNLFDPQGTAIRAEVSAVLRRFVELAISSDTAQGWTMNDSGKWMYYENGKLVTGKKEIDGSTYTFDQYGVTEDVPKNLRYTTYTVQNGDSIWSIAHKLGCTMSELERLNNKSRFTINYPGDVLRVPEK